ncbi:NAD-dependent epimerase/dehydratase family protein [Candidatus Poribacteria bacterium]|nr:NAD-dependent epimerase/dehydratase family protein [Candidatus Poribacteria bacterium]
MKVLVTGASGRLAGYVVRELADKYELVLTSRRKPPEELSDYPWVQGDLVNFQDCQKMMEGVEVIQHLGAQPWPVDHPNMRDRAEEQGIPFDATFKTNMLGTYYLMQAAVEANVKIVVMAGSNCALGHGFRISKDQFPIHFLPINEKHPSYPEDSYSYSKKAGEDLLASFSRGYGIRTYITRPAGITPPERRQKMADNASPTGGWSDWMWCWVGSEDVASAHRLLMEASSDLPHHDVYFLNSDDTTALETSRELVEKFKPELLPLFKAGYMKGNDSFLNCDKLKKAVGWEHKTSWRDLL